MSNFSNNEEPCTGYVINDFEAKASVPNLVVEAYGKELKIAYEQSLEEIYKSIDAIITTSISLKKDIMNGKDLTNLEVILITMDSLVPRYLSDAGLEALRLGRQIKFYSEVRKKIAALDYRIEYSTRNITFEERLSIKQLLLSEM